MRNHFREPGELSRRIHHFARGLWCLLLTGGLLGPVLHASQVKLVDLEQMTRRAGRIFSGRCTGARVVTDPALGRDVTVATFHVERAIKGVTGSTVTVRMLGAAAAGGRATGLPAGIPTFRPGDDVILFLYGESAQGLSSPVGLGQGRFSVRTDKQGHRRAVNDFGNSNLLSGLRSDLRDRLRDPHVASPTGRVSPQRDDLDPDALLDVVATLVAGQPGQ